MSFPVYLVFVNIEVIQTRTSNTCTQRKREKERERKQTHKVSEISKFFSEKETNICKDDDGGGGGGGNEDSEEIETATVGVLEHCQSDTNRFRTRRERNRCECDLRQDDTEDYLITTPSLVSVP